MGGDHLVAAVAGEGVEEEHGDSIRAAEGVLYRTLIHEAEPLPGAQELIRALKAAGCPVVLASSARSTRCSGTSTCSTPGRTWTP